MRGVSTYTHIRGTLEERVPARKIPGMEVPDIARICLEVDRVDALDRNGDRDLSSFSCAPSPSVSGNKRCDDISRGRVKVHSDSSSTAALAVNDVDEVVGVIFAKVDVGIANVIVLVEVADGISIAFGGAHAICSALCSAGTRTRSAGSSSGSSGKVDGIISSDSRDGGVVCLAESITVAVVWKARTATIDVGGVKANRWEGKVRCAAADTLILVAGDETEEFRFPTRVRGELEKLVEVTAVAAARLADTTAGGARMRCDVVNEAGITLAGTLATGRQDRVAAGLALASTLRGAGTNLKVWKFSIVVTAKAIEAGG